MKNHTQLMDLRLSPEDAFKKRLGRNPSNMLGSEIPLGHSYSLILEALAEQRLDATPKPEEFLNFVRGELVRKGAGLKAALLSMMSSSYINVEALAIDGYMAQKGLPQKQRDDVMREILGCTLNEVY